MEKITMREYVADLEARIDTALSKWKKTGHMEDGESVQVSWQFEHAHVRLDIFWHKDKEQIQIVCSTPRSSRRDLFDGLTDATANAIMDRVGNFAQIVQEKRRR